MAEKNQVLVFVGTFSRDDSKGLYVYQLDVETGALELVSTNDEGVSPAYIAIHPSKRFLYAVNEVNEFQGQKSGGLTAYSLDPATGQVKMINQQSSVGTGPCHLSVDGSGRYLLVANYMGGSVAMLPINEDGSLEPACDFHQHEGSSVDPRRQKEPHAHCIMPDPTNQYAFANDLGMDKVLCYKLDLENGKLVPNDIPWTAIAPGAGPRHMVFHPSGKTMYVLTEMGNTMVVLDYDAEAGKLTEKQTVSTLPEGFEGTSYCAAIRMDPTGKFVYASNRGHDSLAIFAIADDGTVSLVGHEPTQGKFPRDFNLDPTGTFLIAANQDSRNMLLYRVDKATGKLSYTGTEIDIPFAVCIEMIDKA